MQNDAYGSIAPQSPGAPATKMGAISERTFMPIITQTTEKTQ